MSRSLRACAAICVAATAVLAACGGDDDATTPETVVPETVAPEPTEPPVTEPPVTEPTTEPSTTEPTTTEPPVTEPPVTEPTTPEAVYGTLVDVATEAGEFTILLTAVEAAGLTETLATRQLTVLAPTDAAFEALGQDVIDGVLADADVLTELLLNHVLPMPQTGAEIGLFNNVLAVGGASWDVDATGDALVIGPATVVTADVPADNGYIHVIDTVLTAPEPEADAG